MNKFKLNHIGSLIFRATINGLGMLSVVYALKFLRVSTCKLILRSGNLMSVFLGYLMLNEKVTIYDIYGLISTFLGVVLILKPSIIFGKTSVGEDQLIGLVFAFICAFIISWGMIISKQLLEYFEVIFTLLFMGFAGCIVGVIVAQIRGIDITIDLWDLFGLMFCILFEFMGALLNFIALGHEPVSKLAPFYNSRIIYSVVLVYVLSGAVDFYDITGVVIIVITYIYISIEKIKLSNNQT